MTAETRSGRWWSRLGFGSVPGDAEETHAFLQKRVAFYLGVACVLWTVISLMLRIATFIAPEIATKTAADPMFTVPPGIALVLAFSWVYLRTGRRPLWVLDSLDAIGTVKQSLFLSTLLTHGVASLRPELNAVTGLSFLVIARAAVVPSTATRTFVISALTLAPVVVGSYTLHRDAPNVALPIRGVMLAVVVWAVLGTLLSTTISRVIYGLHRRVQAATRLGQYVLERKLGEGGMGLVYLAKHAMLRRPTAVKLLPPERAGKEGLARFEREVRLTSTLRHPNTVAIYDYGRTPDGLFYYAMEYLDGFDLERIVRTSGPLPPERVVSILRQVAGALEEAHGAGLVHRDIKPSNIVLCRYGNRLDFAKVLDFGLVRQSQTSAEPGLSAVETLMGTPLYMAPEAVTDPSTVDGRADIYSLGAVAYFLLTGERVFEGKSVVQVCGHHLFSQVVPPSKRLGRALPEALEKLVLDCLEKERDRRVPNAASLLERLDGCGVAAWSGEQAAEWWSTRKAESLLPALGAETIPTALTVEPSART